MRPGVASLPARVGRTAVRWFACWLLACAIATASCTGRAAPAASSARLDAGVGAGARPSDPYGPFPYANDVQRQAFRAFLRCASDHGVELEGPFADSRGMGVMFRNAGQPSAADQQRVEQACPQMDVGIFATPTGGNIHLELFEEALAGYSACMRQHGYPEYPNPHVSSDDPYDVLDRMPFEWDSRRFIEALSACTQPLKDYVFSSL